MPNTTKGGALAIGQFKNLLNASYTGENKVGTFDKDNELSSKTSKVYRDPKTGQVVVAHKGTSGFADWGNNAVYAIGGTRLYKKTKRYKEARNVQKKAEAKYGAQNVTTIGHSQGGLQAQLLGKDSKEILTLNKATVLGQNSHSMPSNQYDIRSSNDIVSKINPFQKKNNNEIQIDSSSHNILKEHSIDTLDRLYHKDMIGRGIHRGKLVHTGKLIL